ncbi:MAG: LacI family transcriptional regulator, repressor for deo operon, udp, cdd, tsx, nupC, and nupG [Microbacteriaceae bacterium]|jgi:DNA-binding LacI/PurR family transcriptional regulator|nr:LacI family transcriptional regulator, repressor for deo operon, udp, cdd, tsx, nupC, and nupG [Microbacteriaceae bacterium]
MVASRLRDVAELAGVSIRTVSNVVNGYVPVSDAKRERVEAAVAALGYRPNVAARNLKIGRSGLIALVVPELDVPYFSELARFIVTFGRDLGFTVVVDQTDGDTDREKELLTRDGRAAMFDGIILSPLALSHADLDQREAIAPLVLLGERIAGGNNDHVTIDNVAAAQEATEHLIDLGRQRIAAIGDQPYETGETAQLRTRGYELAHAARGRAVDPSLIIPTHRFHFSDGSEAMTALLERPGQRPDAVFCYNDLLAIGAIRTLLAAGLRVPEDVAVVGFDDIEAGRYHTPSLTTISPDKPEIARLALDRLVARLGEHAEGPVEELRVPHQLIVRESTVGRPL